MADIFNKIADITKPMNNRESEILNKFSPDFKRLCNTNPVAKAILNTLMRDESGIYTIIEHLINSNELLLSQLKRKIESEPLQRVYQ